MNLSELANKTFIKLDIFLCALIFMMHQHLYFYIKEKNFENIFDALESSPLFDFSVKEYCGSDSHIVFHVWEGINEGINYIDKIYGN